MFSRTLLAGSLWLALLTACDLGTGPVSVAEVEVTAPSASLAVGDTLQLTATAKAASGRELSRRAVTWSSSDEGVATVSAKGVVTAARPGTVTITAAVEDRTGGVSLTVSPVPVASVSISPDTATIQVRSTRQLEATVRDAAGTILTDRILTWASSDTARARVSSTGLVTAAARGEVVITATSEGRSATASVTVTPVPIASLAIEPATSSIPVGGTVQLSIVARDTAGRALAGPTASIRSSDSTIAAVNASGAVKGLAAGTAQITAEVEGKTAKATVTVVPPPGTVTLVNFDRTGQRLTRFDDRGNAIDAHGGEIRYFDGSYYLYGEHYGCGFQWITPGTPFCGFRVYSSPNLVNWTDRGPLFDPTTAMWQARCDGRTNGCFRPHVVYNPATRRYVLWINSYDAGVGFYVFESSSPVGPFHERPQPRLVTGSEPFNGDANLFVDEDGTGYVAYTDWRRDGDIVIEVLRPDFLSGAGRSVALGLRRVEAPAIFKRGGRYYMTISDPNCGYCETGTSYLTAPTALGPWSAPRKLTTTSCGGQPTHVSELPGPQGGAWYLYQSDLWNQGERNEATADQFWAPLSFDAAGEIEPITCRSSYYVPARVGRSPTEAEYYRLRCDIGGAGRVQRAFRFAATAGVLRSVTLNTYQKGSPVDPLVLELREDSPQGKLLHRAAIEPQRVSWSARELSVSLEIPLVVGEIYALRLRSASSTGCYGFAYRDDLASRPADALLSTDGGTSWTSEPARHVKIEFSFQ